MDGYLYVYININGIREYCILIEVLLYQIELLQFLDNLFLGTF